MQIKSIKEMNGDVYHLVDGSTIVASSENKEVLQRLNRGDSTPHDMDKFIYISGELVIDGVPTVPTNKIK